MRSKQSHGYCALQRNACQKHWYYTNAFESSVVNVFDGTDVWYDLFHVPESTVSGSSLFNNFQGAEDLMHHLDFIWTFENLSLLNVQC